MQFVRIDTRKLGRSYKQELRTPHGRIRGLHLRDRPCRDEKGSPTLIVKNKKDKKKQLTITPFSNIVKSGKKGQDEIRLNSVVVYVDKNNTFYLPASLVDFLK